MILKTYTGPYQLFILGLMYALLFSAKGQNVQQLSVPQIHTIVEKYVNYSRDSSLILIELASKKIEEEPNKDLAEMYRAENNLRRADYWTFYSLDSSEFYLNKAFKYYEQHPNDKKLADIYVLKSQIARMLGDFDQGMRFIDSAMEFAENYKDPAFLSFVYYEKAISQQFLEQWESSFENALLAVKNAELSGDSLSMATSYFLMGRTYHHFGLFNSSETFIAKSKDYGKGMAQWYTIIHIYADVLLENKKSNLALISYKEALDIALEKNDTNKAITLCTNIGQIYYNNENYNESETYYAKLNSLLKNKDDGGYKTLLFLAQMHYYFGDENQAKEDLDLFGAKYGSGTIPRYINVYKEAAELHIALDQLDLATFFYKKWGNLKDSLYSYTSMQQLNALEVMYMNERKKNEELGASRQNQATMGALLILVILVSGGLTYYFRMKGLKENEALKYTLKEKQMEQMIVAQETERQRLARELHDGIGQSLAALKMQLQFDKNLNARETTVHRIDTICDEVRSLSHQMMPIALKENGLQSALEQLIDHSFSTSSIEVDFIFFGLQTRLPDHIEVNIYRITQELISNILKHSKASKVGIQLIKRGKKLILIVEDDGIGLGADDNKNGIGMNNINIRLEALKGSVQIQTSDGNGTYINISIPLSVDVSRKIA